jgi:peptidoglycan/LPS O-acetylase OafA/YrhL
VDNGRARRKVPPAMLPAHAFPKRLYLLDLSRGLASLAVVLVHWRQFAFVDGTLTGFVSSDQPLHSVLHLFYDYGHLAVQYFFLLSGFIFFWLYAAPVRQRRLGARAFAVQRLSRLYPLHVATLLLTAGLLWWFTARTGQDFVFRHNDLWHFLLHLGFASNWGFERGLSFNAPVWSVSVEILLYVAFFVVCRRAPPGPWACVVIAVVAMGLYHLSPWKPWYGLALFFLGGALFRACVWLHVDGRRWAALAHVAALTAWTLTLVNCYAVPFDRPLGALVGAEPARLTLMVAVMFALFPLTLCSLVLVELHHGVQLRRLAWIGDTTYATYLLHFPLQITVMLIATSGLLGDRLHTQPWLLPTFFAVLLPLAWAVHRWFERPMQDRLRHALLPPRPPAAVS